MSYHSHVLSFLSQEFCLLLSFHFLSCSFSLQVYSVSFGCGSFLLVLFLCSCKVFFVVGASVCVSVSSSKNPPVVLGFFVSDSFFLSVFFFYWIRLVAASPSLLIMGATAPASLCSRAASLLPSSRESERERYSSYPP